MYEEFDYIIKSVIIGDTGVGKTAILKKISESSYIDTSSPTIGVDFFTVNTIVNKFNIKIHIWDTAGHERYQNLVKTYFKNNAICYVVYDVCNYLSFKSIPMWINTFKNNSSNKNTVIVILANKIDAVRKRIITYEQGKYLANKYNAIYIEVSSMTSVGLDKIVIKPIVQLLNLYESNVLAASDSNGFKNINSDVNKLFLNDKKIKSCCTIQ